MKGHIRARLAAAAILIATGASAWGGGAARSDAKQFRIAISNQGLGYPYPAAISAGIHATAKKLGVKIIADLDAKLDPAKQANDIQDLIAQKPDAIILIPVSSAESAKLVDQISAAHITVVAVHGVIGANSIKNPHNVYPKLTALIDEDEIGAGRLAAQLVKKAVPGGGSVGVVIGSAGFAENELRVRDFKSILGQTGKFKIVASQPGDWVPEKGQSACQNELAAHSDISVFYTLSDDMGVGCAKAVQASGSSAKVIGIGGSKLGINAIRSGQLYGTVCYKPYTEGQLAMNVLDQILTGKVHYKHKGIFYKTPAVTKANLSQCKPQW